MFCESVWKMDHVSEDECLRRGSREFLICGFAFSGVVVCKDVKE